MLNDLYEKLPKKAVSGERFEPIEMIIINQGSKTIIKNYSIICSSLRRDETVLTKYFTRELATPANFSGGKLTIHSKINARLLKEKYLLFIKKYVICPVCKRPDTHIVHDKEHGIKVLKCEACGARNPIR